MNYPMAEPVSLAHRITWTRSLFDFNQYNNCNIKSISFHLNNRKMKLASLFLNNNIRQEMLGVHSKLSHVRT